MKYLVSFNEELKSNTYLKASYKLKKMGHLDRANALKDWAIKTEYRESIELWKENVNTFSKFGTFKLKITPKNKKEEFVGDFYLNLILDGMSFEDLLDDMIDDGEGDFAIMIGIIPANEEILKKCLDNMEISDDFNNGFFWGLIVSFKFNIEGESIKFVKYDMFPYEDDIKTKIYNRASAGKLKTLLKRMFSDKSFNYPSGYNNFDNFYDMVNLKFGAELGLSSKFGFSPEMITNFIDTMSTNEMY